VHDDAPAADDDPTGHDVHVNALFPSEYVPAGQDVHVAVYERSS
jgi:hypothetical protein